METSTKSQEKQNSFGITSQINNNEVQIQKPMIITQTKPNFTSEFTNPYPSTTFIQADTSSFKQVVQFLTGSSETSKQASRSSTNTVDPISKSVIPPIKNGPKKHGFKLYERRNNSFKNIKISPLIPGSSSLNQKNFSFSPRNNNNNNNKYPELLSPSILNFPSLVLSPVTPLIQDNFNRSSSTSTKSFPVFDEEKEIAEKGFYLHPSSSSSSSSSISTTPRDSEPQLLSLFPLTSPRITGSSSC